MTPGMSMLRNTRLAKYIISVKSILQLPLSNRWLSRQRRHCLPWKQQNSLLHSKCHAPVSRIKPFERLLSLPHPLFVSVCAVRVNDFLKIFIFRIRFTCLKCSAEQTKVSETTFHNWAEFKECLGTAGKFQYQHSALQFLCVYISGLCSHPFQRKSPPAKTITPHPPTHPPTKAQACLWLLRLSLTIKPIRSFWELTLVNLKPWHKSRTVISLSF